MSHRTARLVRDCSQDGWPPSLHQAYRGSPSTASNDEADAALRDC